MTMRMATLFAGRCDGEGPIHERPEADKCQCANANPEHHGGVLSGLFVHDSADRVIAFVDDLFARTNRRLHGGALLFVSQAVFCFAGELLRRGDDQRPDQNVRQVAPLWPPVLKARQPGWPVVSHESGEQADHRAAAIIYQPKGWT
jgi:hypothetical protein